jgi:hypothetical protein
MRHVHLEELNDFWVMRGTSADWNLSLEMMGLFWPGPGEEPNQRYHKYDGVETITKLRDMCNQLLVDNAAYRLMRKEGAA